MSPCVDSPNTLHGLALDDADQCAMLYEVPTAKVLTLEYVNARAWEVSDANAGLQLLLWHNDDVALSYDIPMTFGNPFLGYTQIASEEVQLIAREGDRVEACAAFAQVEEFTAHVTVRWSGHLEDVP